MTITEECLGGETHEFCPFTSDTINGLICVCDGNPETIADCHLTGIVQAESDGIEMGFIPILIIIACVIWGFDTLRHTKKVRKEFHKIRRKNEDAIYETLKNRRHT